MTSFRTLSVGSACLFAILSVALLAFPEIIYWLFALEGNELGDFLGKRAGMLFIGFSVLCFQARGSESIEVQGLVAATIASAMGTMALLGVYEWVRGSAGPGIWVAIIVECVITGLYSRVWLRNRRELQSESQRTLIE